MAVTVAPIPPPQARGRSASRLRRIGERWYTPYLFIAPHFLLFALFIGFPFFFGLYISAHRWDFFQASPFVGLDNYIALFDPNSIHFGRFWQAVWNTILFMAISTPLLVGIGLFLAVLLNAKFPGRNFFRGLYIAPWTLSVAVVSLLWWWIFDGTIGIVNQVLINLGVDNPPAWLAENPGAWIAITIATMWWTVGYDTIILLAGLQQIPTDLYEASSIDGANRWQQFRYVTIPSLRPVLLLTITIQMIASFNLLGQPQIMTGGGPPIGETTPILLYMYDVGFRPPYELGTAAAMAYLAAVIVVVVSVVNFRLFRSEQV